MSNATNIAAINAQIDAINAAAEQTGTPADGALLSVLTLEVKALTAVDKAAAARAKYEAQAAVRSIKEDDTVTFVFGRAHNKVILSGRVLSVESEATGLQFTILSGSGKDSKVSTVGAEAILLDADAVAAAQADIDAAVEAKRLADEEKAKEKGEGSAE
ncbi:hypothetical protein [Stenotrophomonas phage BUCT609]|uniref:Uncharacterized protein n=1 Tax=Stenotrophomonas phage BUCT609 TaxID=2834250 RepID=A0A8E6URR5_9CAUD|nr:hypothetical protein [Stenotrophomonas phage BUCT609]